MSTVLSQFIGLLCTALCVPLAISPGVSAEPPKEDAVAVTVGNETIRVGDVQRALTRATGGKPINPAALATLQARTLEEAIQRRLVLAYARRTGLGSKEEFETARSDFLARLAYQHRSLEEYLKSQSISEDDWRRQLVWGVVWEKCLAKHVTPARREAYFQAHRREFDGSLVAVSYILLRPPESGAGVSPAYGRSTGETPVPPKEALVQRAQRLRDEILSGKISFAEAAAKYSAAPSGQQGGRLGQLARHGPMSEAFCRAAFALEIGQISPPTPTPFGVDLIRCDGIKPGGKRLADVGREVDAALARELLERLAAAERRFTPVKYSDAWPRLKP